jgi:hypothetical protein
MEFKYDAAQYFPMADAIGIFDHSPGSEKAVVGIIIK